MESTVLKTKLGKVLRENTLLKFFIVVIAVSNIYLTSKAINKEKIILYPVGYCQKIEVNTRTPDNFYILQMARFIFDSFLSFTPSTIEKQYNAVLAIFDPSVYQKYKKIFTSYIEDVKTAKISSSYIIHKIEHYPKKNIVRVKGKRIVFFGDKPIEISDDSYFFKYKFSYGTFRILEYGKADKLLKKITEEQKEQK